MLVSSCSNKHYNQKYNANFEEVKQFKQVDQKSNDVTNSDLALEQQDLICYNYGSIFTESVTLTELAKLMSIVFDINISTTMNNPNLKISLAAKNICLERLLEELRDSYNIGFKKIDEGYHLFSPQIRTRIFTIRYHKFDRTGSSSVSISNSSFKSAGSAANPDSTTKIDTVLKDDFWHNMEQILSAMVTDDIITGGDNMLMQQNAKNMANGLQPQAIVNKESGTILVRAYPRAMYNIEKFIKQINSKSSRQVMIEAKILEIELKSEMQTGINWSMLKKQFTLESDTNLASDNGLFSAVLGAKITDASGNDYFDTIISLLGTQGKISVLSSPKIAVLNNQRALIKFGNDSYYVTNVSNINLDSSSGKSASSSGVTLDPFFSGIALDTTPVIFNNNELIMHIHPMVTRVIDENKIIQVDDKKSTLPLAKIETRETDTIIKAKSGDVIIIGGLVQDYTSLQSNQLPVNSGVLRKLFSFLTPRNNQNTKSELIILLRPIIVENIENNIDLDQYYLKDSD